MGEPPKKKRKLETLSEYEKVWLARNKQNYGWTYDECRSAFRKEFPKRTHVSLPKSTLSGFLGGKNIGRWLAKDGNMASKDSFRDRKGTFPDVEQALFLWLQQIVHVKNGTLNDAAIVAKAKKLAKHLDVGKDFAFSNGWLQGWKKRFGVKCYTKHGEAAAANDAGVTLARTELKVILEEYDANDIYNYDETGLFWKQQPSRTLAAQPVSGGKAEKQRMSIGLCCNTSGTHKLKPVVVHVSETPRVFKQTKFDPHHFCHWYSNPSAWVTSGIFRDVVAKWNAVFRRMNRKVVILMDNAPVHIGFNVTKVGKFDSIELSFMRIIFLPPNTTSKVQPLDQGIIKSFKLHYRKLLTHWLIEEYEEQAEEVSLSKIKPNAKQALLWIVKAWQEVTPSTITNCWRHSGILSDNHIPPGEREQNDERALLENDKRSYDSEVSKLTEILSERDKETFDPLTAEDDITAMQVNEDGQLFELMNDETLIENVRNEDAITLSDEEEDDEMYQPRPMPTFREVKDAADTLHSFFNHPFNTLYDASKCLQWSEKCKQLLHDVRQQQDKKSKQTDVRDYYMPL